MHEVPVGGVIHVESGTPLQIVNEGEEELRAIAHELVDTVRQNVSIDWTVRESVRDLVLERPVPIRPVVTVAGAPPVAANR